MTEFWDNIFGNIVGDALFGLIAFVLGILFSRYREKVASITKGKPTISPDGEKVVYEANGDIHITDSDKGLHSLVGGHNNRFPLWSKDSKYLAFSSFYNKSWDVFVVSLKTGKAVRMTTAPGPERPVGWSDNGELLISMGGAVLTVSREEVEKRIQNG